MSCYSSLSTETGAKSATQIASEIIAEEPEIQTTGANNSLSSQGSTPNSLRKSPRIAAKRASRNSLNKSDSESNFSLNNSKTKESKQNATQNATIVPNSPKTLNAIEECKSREIDKVALDSRKCIADSLSEFKQQARISRSKSLTNTPKSMTKVDDSENGKDETVTNTSFHQEKISNDAGAGDIFVCKAKVDTEDLTSTDITLNISKKRDISDMASEITKSNDKTDGIDTVDTSINKTLYLGSVDLLDNKVDDIKCKVYIEDSDSNTNSIDNNHNVQTNFAEDQCVPFVKKLIKPNKPYGADTSLQDKASEIEPNKEKSLFMSKPLNCSIEPMDIDETISENISLLQPTNELANTSNRKELSGANAIDAEKSLLSKSDKPQNTGNEDKSTLILSRLKDDSVTDVNVTKSPKNNDTSKTKFKGNSRYTGCTPPKHKNLQQGGMQTSTPVLATNIGNNNSTSGTPKYCSSIVKSHDKDDEASVDSSDEEVSQKKCELLDDEAEDAGDHYESGDSQDDSERQYIKDNEIVEPGETLTSEEEISSEEDYEKDSFCLSSDEEDLSLLSGSGDDLSLGDNELNMSSKSKQKYNERKVKEQKKASREMYEARHGTKKKDRGNQKALDKESKESSDEETLARPLKKIVRQRIDSSPLQSGDESIIKPGKHTRLRLDSTSYASHVESSNGGHINKKKSKKIKALDDTITSENEITLVGDVSMLEKNDPLKTEVKLEPKTPQTDFNLSRVNFTTVMDVEQVQLVENSSMLKANDTSDPLQSTVTHDGEASDSSSESEEIMQNYDSMLSSLNKQTKGGRIDLNRSLNSIKKAKRNSRPIIDQLNLTETKTVKNSTGKLTKMPDTNYSLIKTNKNYNDFCAEEAPDTMDLKLIFSGDDASESGDGKKISVPGSCYPGDEDFIPLKRTEGKTNLREHIGKQCISYYDF